MRQVFYPVELIFQTGQSYQNCTSPPNSTEGTCKHLKDCVIVSILNSFEEYIPLFCAIENM